VEAVNGNPQVGQRTDNLLLKISHRYRKIVKTEMISISYAVNNHVYSKSQNPFNFVRV